MRIRCKHVPSFTCHAKSLVLLVEQIVYLWSDQFTADEAAALEFLLGLRIRVKYTASVQ